MGNTHMKWNWGRNLVSVFAAFTLATVSTAGFAAPAKKKRPDPKHVPGEMIVKFRGQFARQSRDQLAKSITNSLPGIQILKMNRFRTDARLYKVKIAQDTQLDSAIQNLKHNPQVQVAEPNFIYHKFDAGMPNDPDFAKLWSLKNTGQADSSGHVGKAGSDINVLPLWAQGITGSKDIIVAVIDTGVDWDHPDLKANLYTNKGEVDGNGKDDDGNGFIDDIHGWNFFANNNNSRDDNDHGSHCSGTIGGVGNNGVGIAGVNWNVSILPVKFLSGAGSGTLEGAVEAVNYATMMKANLMSNSWGGGGFSQTLFDAIKAAKDKGILFVAAAGNDGSNNDTTPTYPASYDLDNIIAVAATDNQDKIASFSNFGTNRVHVAAPGVNIWSSTKGGTYQSFSGTSMATPHVSGIAALMLSAHPSLTYKEVKQRLIETSVPVRGLRRLVAAHGRVDAYNAVMGITPPSNEPPDSAWKDVADSTESEHPYANSLNKQYKISHPGAKYIRVVFEKVETESGYDKIAVQSSSGEVIDEVSGSMTNYRTDYAQGDSLTLHFTSDASVNGWGFKVAKIQIIE